MIFPCFSRVCIQKTFYKYMIHFVGWRYNVCIQRITLDDFIELMTKWILIFWYIKRLDRITTLEMSRNQLIRGKLLFEGKIPFLRTIFAIYPLRMMLSSGVQFMNVCYHYQLRTGTISHESWFFSRIGHDYRESWAIKICW